MDADDVPQFGLVAEDVEKVNPDLVVRDADGKRPVLGDHPIQDDPEFRDHMLFYEYFHGDTGRGVGASHQTGWSGLVALLLQPRTATDACTLSVAQRTLEREPV